MQYYATVNAGSKERILWLTREDIEDRPATNNAQTPVGAFGSGLELSELDDILFSGHSVGGVVSIAADEPGDEVIES